MSASTRVIIATFSHPIEAHVAKSKLESEGIDCILRDENMISMNWLYSNAIGGVKLEVAVEDEQRAREALAREETLDSNDTQPDENGSKE